MLFLFDMQKKRNAKLKMVFVKKMHIVFYQAKHFQNTLAKKKGFSMFNWEMMTVSWGKKLLLHGWIEESSLDNILFRWRCLYHAHVFRETTQHNGTFKNTLNGDIVRKRKVILVYCKRGRLFSVDDENSTMA